MEWAGSNRGIQLKTPEVKPSGEDNGTEKANYTVVFTPSETNIYLR